jgi:hypothetical protein
MVAILSSLLLIGTSNLDKAYDKCTLSPMQSNPTRCLATSSSLYRSCCSA